MRIATWNINSVRLRIQLVTKFLIEHDIDVLCLQETKAKPEQVAGVGWPRGFAPHWNSAEKPGYAGTATFAKKKPRGSTTGIGANEHDREGRVVTLEYDTFFLVNVYTPNSQRELTRLAYRTREWEPAFRRYLKKLEETKPVIFCGDLNVAHTENDLANPKTNRKNAGFTDEEREGLSNLLAEGFLDSFRHLYPDKEGVYSWWSYRAGARARNVGWRIDYFVVSDDLAASVRDSWVLPEWEGSDHCPVGLSLTLG